MPNLPSFTEGPCKSDLAASLSQCPLGCPRVRISPTATALLSTNNALHYAGSQCGVYRDKLGSADRIPVLRHILTPSINILSFFGISGWRKIATSGRVLIRAENNLGIQSGVNLPTHEPELLVHTVD